jgi:hypothetical protein
MNATVEGSLTSVLLPFLRYNPFRDAPAVLDLDADIPVL